MIIVITRGWSHGHTHPSVNLWSARGCSVANKNQQYRRERKQEFCFRTRLYNPLLISFLRSEVGWYRQMKGFQVEAKVLSVWQRGSELHWSHQVGTLPHWCIDDRPTTPPEGPSATSGVPDVPPSALNPSTPQMLFWGPGGISPFQPEPLACLLRCDWEDFDGLALGLASNS